MTWPSTLAGLLCAALMIVGTSCRIAQNSDDATHSGNMAVRQIDENTQAFLLDGDLFSTVETRPLAAELKIHRRANESGRPPHYLKLDGKSVWWEFDTNDDGVVDHVRIHLFDGRWLRIRDVDHDGEFDVVETSGTSEPEL